MKKIKDWLLTGNISAVHVTLWVCGIIIMVIFYAIPLFVNVSESVSLSLLKVSPLLFLSFGLGLNGVLSIIRKEHVFGKTIKRAVFMGYAYVAVFLIFTSCFLIDWLQSIN